MQEPTAPYQPSYEETEVSRRYARRNFWLGVLNGTLYISGLAFSQPPTVFPIFVSLFTKSSVLIGLSGTLTSVGWLLPQLLVARYTEHMPKKMKLYRLGAGLRLGSWLALTLLTLWAKEMRPALYLALFFLFLSGFALFGGLSGVAFLDIVGKTIPPNRRGRYFGYRRFFSGIIASIAGLVVAYILGNSEKFPFPTNYFTLFLLTFIFILSGILCFFFVVEPEGSVDVGRERTHAQFLQGVTKVLSEDKNYVKFLAVMVLSSASSLAIPFYVVYARQVLAAPAGWVGAYVTIEMVATLVSNLLWGYLGDAKGYRLVILTCSLLSVLAPVVALLSPNFYVFGLVFVLKGAGWTGIWMAKNNYALEVAPVVRRPTYIGILNTSLAFSMLLPVLGGVVVDATSFTVLFAITIGVTVPSFILAKGLAEPRGEAGQAVLDSMG